MVIMRHCDWRKGDIGEEHVGGLRQTGNGEIVTLKDMLAC